MPKDNAAVTLRREHPPWTSARHLPLKGLRYRCNAVSVQCDARIPRFWA